MWRRFGGLLMFDDARIARLDFVTRMAGLLAAAICITAPLYTHVTIDYTDTELPLLCFVLMAAIAVVYGRWRGAPKIANAAATTADLIGFALVLGTISYLGVAMNRPSMASGFAAADRAIGFDWMHYAPFVNAHPGLERLMWAAYSTMVPQLGVLVLAFALMGRQAWLRILVDAFCLMALIAIFISWLLPAVDADVFFGTLVVDRKATGWSTPLVRVEHFLNLRDGYLTRIPVMDSTGLVTFPSFHTMCGVLFAVCFAQFRWLKWPMVVVNGLLIASTPVEGGHYGVDVLAGLTLATAVLWGIFAFVRVGQTRQESALAAA